MRIEHIAFWVNDLEKMKDFYLTYFNAACNNKYVNTKKQFESYFLSFGEGARIELMHRTDITQKNQSNAAIGLAHIAIATGSKTQVDELTVKLRNDGYTITGEPRTTGDGYYESVILDPEGNHIEITI